MNLPLMDANSDNPLEASIARLRAEQEEHLRLCDEARQLGIPTSLEDPRSPKTVQGLRAAIRDKREP